ncbi:NtaA/DmoA family FMN-dependent monooxygenase [Streptococcus marmotae]|uniref:NtaA/DmoA family FMN-dependent monooxygenase n=1 Tax=Streptococcus marmotae TaxID=1825069 RepID=UPI00082F7A4F|nr:NtaA/DmoA family FMN-dependent monooxygenase [Streptococcus marmotae]
MTTEQKKQMMLGLASFGATGLNFRSWMDPVAKLESYPDITVDIKAAQLAEKGKFQFMFFGDFPGTKAANNGDMQSMGLDPLLIATLIANHTSHIGFGITRATSWSNPYELARQFKTLDALSQGRVAWNAVTGANGVSANAYGIDLAHSFDRYSKANEFTELVQTLWASWGKDALKLGHSTKEFADYAQVKSINFKGQYVKSSGSLPIPPSQQGQPVIFHSGGSENSIAFAGKYADVFVGEVWTIEQGQAIRQALRQAAVANGRQPDDIKFIAGVMPLLGDTKKEALERHASFIDGDTFLQRVAHIGYVLGVDFTPADLERPIDPSILDQIVITPYSDPRIENVVKVAREGWTLRELVYHSVIDYYPAAVGTAQDVADHLTDWFESDAADGFWVMPDSYEVDLPRFVDEVVPILQERGIFHKDYEGTTLRENLGVPYQYGLRGESEAN